MDLRQAMFGEPLLTRTSEIAAKTAGSHTYYPLEVMGKYRNLRQITVRIGMPVYRIANGRTRTFQREFLATHPDVPADLFTLDPDGLEAQRAQHEILRRLADDEGLWQEFQGGTQQTEPILLTNTGVVVNGNRRLCVWRTLFERDPETYRHFAFVEAAILPEACDEAEIRALEKRLQIQKSHRAPYKWHNKAAMMKEEREAGAPPEALAKSYDVSRKEVDLLIGAFAYAEEYLRRIGKADQWSLVDEDEFAFRAMVAERKKLRDQGRKELFEAVCFRLTEAKDYQGRLYAGIPEIAEQLDILAARLREEGLLPPADAAEPADAAAEEDLSLLGGAAGEQNAYSELAAAIRASDVPLGGLVRRVSDEQRAIQSEQKSAKYLLHTLANISRSLWNVRTNGLHERTVVTGVREQLAAIEENLAAITRWLDERP